MESESKKFPLVRYRFFGEDLGRIFKTEDKVLFVRSEKLKSDLPGREGEPREVVLTEEAIIEWIPE